MIETKQSKTKPPMFNFEKLDVWQKAIDFADLVYDHTRNFPADERFGLTNQMRRAAVSISSNIAEGTSRMSQSDFRRFVEIATGSVFEVISQAFVGRRQGFLAEEAFAALYSSAEEVGRMLSGLRKSLSGK
ncbi:MAG TPA: four helix bundle protein [Chthoniobacterales bacterium]|nr:four helix bundle protein [Chthoniobacterales bacterium]